MFDKRCCFSVNTRDLPYPLCVGYTFGASAAAYPPGGIFRSKIVPKMKKQRPLLLVSEIYVLIAKHGFTFRVWDTTLVLLVSLPSVVVILLRAQHRFLIINNGLVVFNKQLWFSNKEHGFNLCVGPPRANFERTSHAKSPVWNSSPDPLLITTFLRIRCSWVFGTSLLHAPGARMTVV